ncbi:MAG: T9SS type A sorting domain-containing protein [Flavobacteriales bacterium]|nr:T9SS type A sorting domain-containing protein [Flavobacteriales bacterium]
MTSFTITLTDGCSSPAIRSIIAKPIQCSGGIGIESYGQIQSFSVYPNPVSSELIIKHLAMEDGVLEIYNSLGQKVLEQSINGEKNLIRISISGLKNGLYVLQIKSAKAIYRSQQIVISH